MSSERFTKTSARFALATAVLLGPSAAPGIARPAADSHPEAAFEAALLSLRGRLGTSRGELGPEGQVWRDLEARFPAPCDWALQDAGPGFLEEFAGAGAVPLLRRMAERAIEELGKGGSAFRSALEVLASERPEDAAGALRLYLRACEERRARRLSVLLARAPRIVFTKHETLGGSHYAYTEALSDAQDERHFHPGSSLCLLEIEGTRGRVRTLIESREGSIRDPDVDFDGRRVLFSWKKFDREDDFHLYEMDVATGEISQITWGLGFADYEGVYTPAGDIVFNSTRPVQTVDCWWTEVSNLYTVSRDGRRLRRLAFDQVHDNFPTILPDGRVVYTRWDYNDRGQIFVQGLFVMRPDGTGQTAFYGNNSWFPTSILHARGIPGTREVVAILSGHHTLQVGKLAVIDPGKGTEEDLGVRLIAPEREAVPERADLYGQDGELFQYPYPLSEDAFLVAMSPLGRARAPLRFGIYLVTRDGRRELLAADPEISSNQPIPLVPRARPPAIPSFLDHRETTGTFFVQDVYSGPGLEGVPRGSVKTLRVVALSYRAAGIRTNFSVGPAGDSQASTPISIGNGAWDVKRVLGEAEVEPDGSAWFVAPARTPVYFQALDERGYALQTMRSWATLGPGERASCVGCHEPKSAAPRARFAGALRAGPKPLRPTGDPSRGFSFPRDVQPILDRHCVSCHAGREDGPGSAFSLSARANPEEISGRAWTDAYLALTAPRPRSLYGYPPALEGDPEGPLVRWVSAQSPPPMLPPRSTGAVRSPLMALLEGGHQRVRLSREELAAIACWIDLGVPYCGDYEEASIWSDEEREKYRRFLEKRK